MTSGILQAMVPSLLLSCLPECSSIVAVLLSSSREPRSWQCDAVHIEVILSSYYCMQKSDLSQK